MIIIGNHPDINDFYKCKRIRWQADCIFYRFLSASTNIRPFPKRDNTFDLFLFFNQLIVVANVTFPLHFSLLFLVGSLLLFLCCLFNTSDYA